MLNEIEMTITSQNCPLHVYGAYSTQNLIYTWITQLYYTSTYKSYTMGYKLNKKNAILSFFIFFSFRFWCLFHGKVHLMVSYRMTDTYWSDHTIYLVLYCQWVNFPQPDQTFNAGKQRERRQHLMDEQNWASDVYIQNFHPLTCIGGNIGKSELIRFAHKFASLRKHCSSSQTTIVMPIYCNSREETQSQIIKLRKNLKIIICHRLCYQMQIM